MRQRFLAPIALALALAPIAACSGVDYVEIEPASANLQRRGEVLWLRAKAMSRSGVYFPRTYVEWSCDNPKVVTIDTAGRITGTGPGHTICTAKAGGKTGTVDVDVQTVESVRIEPATLTLYEQDDPFTPKVMALDQAGHELHGRIIDMKSKDEHIASVDGEHIYPVSEGTTEIIMRADDRSTVLPVTILKGHAKGKKPAQ
jgi:hypothetical protein